MSQEEREDTTIYKVVVNQEEQYSIWPADLRQDGAAQILRLIEQTPATELSQPA